MKANPNIDELLNSFVDGELTQEQQTRVQRMIAGDAQIARRLRQLQKCKTLVGSLPRAEVPSEMVEQVKASLERRTLLGQQPPSFEASEGARHLLVRKVVAAAAMVGLASVLAVVIYTIVVPQSSTERMVAVEHRPRPYSRSGAATGFRGRLELKTAALIVVDAFVKRAIEDNGLSDCLSPASLPVSVRPGLDGQDKRVYSLSCSKDRLNLLLADLGNIWRRFDSATLFVETEQFAERIMVDAVTAEQTAEIVNQDSSVACVELAKDFALLNRMVASMPGRQVLAAIDDVKVGLVDIPKPVLTGSEKTLRKPIGPAGNRPQVHLTIVVVGSE